MSEGADATVVLRVHVFAWLKEAIGAPILSLEANPVISPSDLLVLVALKLPLALRPRLQTCMLAVDDAYVAIPSAAIDLRGKSIAIIPPVSGG